MLHRTDGPAERLEEVGRGLNKDLTILRGVKVAIPEDVTLVVGESSKVGSDILIVEAPQRRGDCFEGLLKVVSEVQCGKSRAGGEEACGRAIPPLQQ